MRINRKLKTTFNRVSKAYDSARPSYPKTIFDDVIKISELKKDNKVLDIGCGSGNKVFYKISNNRNRHRKELHKNSKNQIQELQKC